MPQRPIARAYGDDGSALDRELEQYRQAVSSLLEPLECIVEYRFKIRKPDLATVIVRNRKQIVGQIS